MPLHVNTTDATRVNVNTTVATTGATALLLPAQNTREIKLCVRKLLDSAAKMRRGRQTNHTGSGQALTTPPIARGSTDAPAPRQSPAE